MPKQSMVARRGSMPKLSNETQNLNKTIHSKACKIVLIPKLFIKVQKAEAEAEHKVGGRGIGRGRACGLA